MVLRLRDSRTGSVRSVRPSPGRSLTMYVCGPTVYDVAHVGHARTYLTFDLLRRAIEDQGQRVYHVMNVTDFEDKIDARAREIGISWRALARREEARFLADLERLNIRAPRAVPRASTFVPAMVQVARRLARTGRIYREGDSWYYAPPPSDRWKNFPVGADLARHAVPEPGHPFPKDDGRDFLIWRRQDPPLPSWPGPWGRGVPGWQLECYAMARHFLGIPVDLHGGGIDLLYPHHYAGNEIAFALDHAPFARTFYHGAFVLYGGRKMSKSRGNLVPLATAIDRAGPDGVRWYLLGPPPTQRLAWTDRGLREAAAQVARLSADLSAALEPGAGGSIEADDFRATAESVSDALQRGFRPDLALGHLRSLDETIRRASAPRLARGEAPAARAALRRIERLLGLSLGNRRPGQRNRARTSVGSTATNPSARGSR